MNLFKTKTFYLALASFVSLTIAPVAAKNLKNPNVDDALFMLSGLFTCCSVVFSRYESDRTSYTPSDFPGRNKPEEEETNETNEDFENL